MDEPLIVAPTQDEIDKLRGYRITKWQDWPNYECVYCQYATLWKNKIEKHLSVGDHPWAYPGQNPPSVGSTSDEPEY